VLCTTEPEKLPITILSRCQRFDFVTVDAPAIARRLAQIVEAEGGRATPEALALIARRAAGSMRDSQSLLEQLLGAATGEIGIDEVHGVIGTGREELVGRLVRTIVDRDARAALEAFDATLSGGADPGGVLEQVIAALRDALVASVGCGPGTRGGPMLDSDALGIDLAALGPRVGTETLLAMLQIVDQALARMRTSGHAAIVAEMAIVRLAKLEDLDNLAAVAHGIVTEGAAGPPSAPPAQTAPREKKTADLTAGAGRAADASAAGPAQAANPAGHVVADAAVAPPAPDPARPLPADARAAWLQACEMVGGLAADFAAVASSVRWNDDVLEVSVPGDATTAVGFLRRPEVSASVARGLAELAGRAVRHVLVVEPPPVGGASNAPAERPRPVPSQAALLRDVMEHPLVAQARTLFDAAVRKVEPPRPAAATPPEPAAASPATAAVTADDDEEETDG